jgi:hypothetical protein
VTINRVRIGEWIYWPLIHSLVSTSNYSATATLHKSQQHPPSFFQAVFTSRSLATTSKSGDSSASLAQASRTELPENWVWVLVWVLCYDRRSVSQSILEQSTHLGLTTRFLLLSDNYGFPGVGCSLWREDGSVVYNCCWPSPAQSFSGPSPVGLVTIFYCLRFETSCFVASYDSQGYAGGIKPCLHTGLPDNWLCPLLITSRHGPHRKHPVSNSDSIVACLFVASGMCLPSRCPETAPVTE